MIVPTKEEPNLSARADIKARLELKGANGCSPNPSILMGRDKNKWLKFLLDLNPTLSARNGPAIGLRATHTRGPTNRIARESLSFQSATGR